MIFYLGTHEPSWLARAGVPLFVSRVRLVRQHSLPRAIAPWALDSGGFSELSLRGRWTVSALRYAAEVRRFRDEIGSLEWAAPQDWMCEPSVLALTGLSVEEHQRRTIESYLTLRALAPDLPWIPVVQGWGVATYWRHVEDYDRAGVDLRTLPTVGVGTVCRRQNTLTGATILRTLAGSGLRVHGFGFKTEGLRAVGDVLESADSMAWSLAGRRREPLPGCKHKNCANCMRYALEWRGYLLDELSPQAVAS